MPRPTTRKTSGDAAISAIGMQRCCTKIAAVSPLIHSPQSEPSCQTGLSISKEQTNQRASKGREPRYARSPGPPLEHVPGTFQQQSRSEPLTPPLSPWHPPLRPHGVGSLAHPPSVCPAFSNAVRTAEHRRYRVSPRGASVGATMEASNRAGQRPPFVTRMKSQIAIVFAAWLMGRRRDKGANAPLRQRIRGGPQIAG
jgi:hypothetical protein